MAHERFDLQSIEQYLRQMPLRRWVTGAGMLVAVVVFLIGLFTCYYTVAPEGKAVVKRFGKVVATRDPGLHFKIPFWVDRAYFVPTERVLKQEFGFRTVMADQRTSYSKFFLQGEHTNQTRKHLAKTVCRGRLLLQLARVRPARTHRAPAWRFEAIDRK